MKAIDRPFTKIINGYAHAQVHPGGMNAEGIGMGRWAF
jgi:hypothetical protein